MPHFGYIDESGTKDDQEVMTAALIVLEGRATAVAIHKHVIQEVHPKFRENKRDRRGDRPSLHFADMKLEHMSSCGRVLASYPINCFCCHYYHDGREKTHEERHLIYRNLVENCVFQALEFYDNLEIGIAQQGNWKSYSAEMTESLNQVVLNASGRFGFKQATFNYLPAARPGIQLADYYAGAARGHLLRHKEERLGAAYDLIEAQVRDVQLFTKDVLVKAKG